MRLARNSLSSTRDARNARFGGPARADLGQFYAVCGTKSTKVHLYVEVRADLGRFDSVCGSKATKVHRRDAA
jgi:hypothetical protein